MEVCEEPVILAYADDIVVIGETIGLNNCIYTYRYKPFIRLRIN